MVFIEENSVMVHATSVTATTRMLSVFADAAMASTNVSSLFSILS